MNRKKAAVFAFLLAALSTPLGAFVAYPLVNFINDDILGLLLGFVSGVLIYISASHLLPEASEHEKKHSSLAFVFGIMLSLLITFLKSQTQ